MIGHARRGSADLVAGTRRDPLGEVRTSWAKLGQTDPLWAVCVDHSRRGGRWDPAQLLASGRREVGDAIAVLDRLGLCARRERALDFGCGVGRLTAALTDHFAAVTGVDISAPMLAQARAINSAVTRCTFLSNDAPDLRLFADGSFDLVYSSLVLQHLPPPVAARYLAEFARVVRAGGAIALLVPERHLRTPRGFAYAYAPQRVIAWFQLSVFGYPAPMRMHALPAGRVKRVVEPLGARLIASERHPGYGGHWRMAMHFVAAPSVPAASHPAPSTPVGQPVHDDVRSG